MRRSEFDFFDEDEQLSSDLEYLLSRGDSSDPLLARMLVSEFYVSAFRLALALTGDFETAGYASLQAFIQAELEVYRYSPELDARDWFFTIMLDVDRRVVSSQRRWRWLRLLLPFPRLRQDSEPSQAESERSVLLWQAVDRLPGKERLPVLAQYLLGWTPQEIARRIKVGESEVHTRLENARWRLLDELQSSGFSMQSSEASNLDAILAASLQARWPEPELTSEDLEAVAAEVHYQASQQAGRARRGAYFKEIALVVVVGLLVAGLIWGVNQLVPEPDLAPTPVAARRSSLNAAATLTPAPIEAEYFAEAGESLSLIARKFGISVQSLAEANFLRVDASLDRPRQLTIPLSLPPENAATSTPVIPVVHSTRPLNTGSDPETIRNLLSSSESQWRTLRASLRTYYYGPAGYVGPGVTIQNWVWVSRPGKSLSIDYYPHLFFLSSMLVRDGLVFYIYDDGLVIARDLDKGEMLVSFPEDLLMPSRSVWFQHGGQLRVLGIERLAGRPALTVEWRGIQRSPVGRVMEPARLELAIDTEYGVVLRLRHFDGRTPETLIEETVVGNIAYDVDFPPPDPFDLRNSHEELVASQFPDDYASKFPSPQDMAQGHERLPLTTAPPGIDPAAYPLTFQYPADADISSLVEQQDVQLNTEVFAGRYYLGNLVFPGPFNIVCDRSPDGRRLAYLSQMRGNVQWVDLDDLGAVHTLVDQAGVYDLAFSPDSRKLALAAYGFDESVSILDLESGVNQMLLEKAQAYGLTWSPNGRYLSFIGSVEMEPEAYRLKALIVSVPEGEIVYSLTLPDSANVWSGYEPAASSWPVRNWGVQFPTIRVTGLGSCTGAP